MKINKQAMREAREKRKRIERESVCQHNFLPCEKPNYLQRYHAGVVVDGVIKYHKCANCGKEVGS